MKVKRVFSLPEKGEVFTDQVLDRCKNLCATKVWGDLDSLRLDAWMRNFSTSLDRYFAACVLDALIYRSRKQTVALMEQLFQRSVADLCRSKQPPCSPADDWFEALTNSPRREDPGIRVVPVIRSSDPPTKSGPFLARLYRRELGFREDLMIWPWMIQDARASGARVFIFIDDILGTSRQFQDFCLQFGLQNQLDGAFAIYAPLVAHNRGLELLRARLPFIHVCSAEMLDGSHQLFSKEATYFSDEHNDASLALRYYYDFLQKKNVRIPKRFILGYGRLALAYSFEHSTPNNCLPILWIPFANWEPLFER